MKLRILSIFLGTLALFMNPTFGCSSSSDVEWNFSEADMRTAVAGTYIGAYGISTETITLNLDEAKVAGSSATQSISAPRLQCGSRSFIRPAAACMSETTMSLSGDVSSSNGTVESATMSGTFYVYSLNLSSGRLELELADGSSIMATFQEGKLIDWQLTSSGGANTVSLALVRQ